MRTDQMSLKSCENRVEIQMEFWEAGLGTNRDLSVISKKTWITKKLIPTPR